MKSLSSKHPVFKKSHILFQIILKKVYLLKIKKIYLHINKMDIV